MSRGALQDHQRILIREGLMFRPTDVDTDFELTPLGEYVIQLLEQDADRLLDTMEHDEELETAIREENTGDSGLPVDESELERAIETEKWRRLDNDIGDSEG
jgi:hypothetical protein